ncbi:MAG TPA: PrsW family intramembrane metalloprotease [Pyrinomonadaceae bacterium]|jgi:RsiW-degrading membrane proteinase PrsW (M82 family)|nr:PrsW family intramembrane metalloprotease [Pyrinomonadaceae bacterium]
MMNDPRAVAAASPAAPVRLKPNTSKSVIKIIFAITAALVALLLGLIVLLLIGVETGVVPLLIGLISATLPVPLYLMLVLWIDRYEAEPLWMLATAFFWGALVAVFFAYLINTASGLIVTGLTNDVRAGAAFGAVISAPIVEESAKALILFIFFFAKKDEFDGVIDGIVYAAMVGLGFAMTENIQYYGRAVMQAGGEGLTVVFIIRGALAPFSHPMFTSLTGIGLGLARLSRNTLVKIIAPIFGLAAAISMHSIWNGSAVIFGAGGFILAYILIMVPSFFIMFVVIALALWREGKVVREYLTPDFQSGLINQQEFNQLGSIFGRMGAAYGAFSRGGFRGWQTCRQLNQTASELAFHRARLARGIAIRDAAEREAAYRLAMEDLLRQLRAAGK